MRRLSAVLILILFATPAWAEDEAQPKRPAPADPAPDERVWEGYLWNDEQGRLRIGWPVIAMGVMAAPEHVIDVEDVERLTPLLTPAESYYIFWNYTLEESREKAMPKLPKVLVRVRGRVKSKGRDAGDLRGGGISFGEGTLTMTKPRFLSVEFVSEDWLEAWAPIFREPWSPWRIRKRPQGDKEAETKKLVPRMVDTLRAMRAVGGPTEAQRRLVATLLPGTEVVSQFREAKETDLLRWIRTMAKQHGLRIEGLEALGSVPPTGTELQRWFVKAKSRDAFLAEVRKRWKGKLGALQLPYYVRNQSGGVSWTRDRLDVVAAWSAETFLAHQERTRETLEK